MESLYDVFSAIRDDEGDHVGTMAACLDPTVAKLSPSLERKALTAIATATAIAMFLSTGETGGELSEVVDGIDTVIDDTVATALVDSAMAGMAGFARQFGQDPDEGIVLADIFEVAAWPEAVREFFAAVLTFLSRLL